MLQPPPFPPIPVEPEKIQFTSQQLYDIFSKYRTVSLKVSNLAGRQTPTYEEFKLFNPRVEEDKIFRQIFEEDIQSGLDTLEFQAIEINDVRHSATARLAARTGEVKEVTVAVNETSDLSKFTTQVSDKLTLEVNSNNEKEPIPLQDLRGAQQQIHIQTQYVVILNNVSDPPDLSDLPLFKNLKDNDPDEK